MSAGKLPTRTLAVDVGPTEVGPKQDWSLLASMETTRRFLASHQRHFEAGRGGLAELAALAELVDQAQSVLDAAVRCSLVHDNASFREIATALDVTQQAVAKRYAGASSRPSGGQRAGDR